MLNKTRLQLQQFKLAYFTSFFWWAGAIYAVSQLAWLRPFQCREWLKLGDKSEKTVKERDYLMFFQRVLVCLNIKSSTLHSFHKPVLFLHTTLSCWGRNFISLFSLWAVVCSNAGFVWRLSLPKTVLQFVSGEKLFPLPSSSQRRQLH